MTKDEICGLLRQIHDVLAMQSETNQVKPVAWMDRDGDIYKELPNEYWNPPHTPIYTKREWVGLTDKEIEAIWKVALFADYGVGAELSNQPFVHYARAIQAKLKERNT